MKQALSSSDGVDIHILGKAMHFQGSMGEERAAETVRGKEI